MKSFNQFITESKILSEGGNAPFINRETGEKLGDAQKIDLNKVNRTKLAKSLQLLFAQLNKLYEKKHGEKLWNDFSVIETGHAFNGSSEHFFNKNISDAEFKKHKPMVGDIDVTIHNDEKVKIKKLKPLFDLLSELENKKITNEFVYKGQNKKQQQGHQINAIFQLQNPKINVQVDFEGVSYTKDHKPTPFAKFSHNSSWDDIQRGMKGVGHKLLIQNLARALSEMKDVVVLTKTSPSEPPEKVTVSKAASAEAPTNLAFSVDKGIRYKYVPAVDSKGNQIKVDGKLAFRELEIKKENKDKVDKNDEQKDNKKYSEYHTEIPVIFKMIFKKEPKDNDIENFHSFSGLLELIKKYNVEEDLVKKAFTFLLDKSLFGKAAQGFEKNNPEGDRKIKMKIVEELIKEFDYLKPIYDEFEEQIETYYKNYKTVKVEA